MAAVVLAAGASTRLGEPKQLVRLGGEALVARAVRLAREAGCAPVLVVLGAHAAEVREAAGEAAFVRNPDWQQGMGSSLRAGIAAVPEGAERLLVMTCDQPAVTAAHLRALIVGCGARAVASAYAGRRGVPACFPRTLFALLRAAEGDQGARAWLADADAVELPGGELDIDTPESLAEACERFER